MGQLLEHYICSKGGSSCMAARMIRKSCGVSAIMAAAKSITIQLGPKGHLDSTGPTSKLSHWALQCSGQLKVMSGCCERFATGALVERTDRVTVPIETSRARLEEAISKHKPLGHQCARRGRELLYCMQT
eukprot:894412-Amphidinium_carterae.1